MNLFWCLPPASQAALMQYQHDNYGEKLEIFNSPMPLSNAVEYSVQLENLEEIARLMRQAPSQSRGKSVMRLDL